MKDQKINTKPLTDIEWETCWMAIRYAMNRQTIASSLLPYMLIQAYWTRWTDDQKRTIYRDLKSNEDYYTSLKSAGESAFGNKDIDRPIWLKFMEACNIDNHWWYGYEDRQVLVFQANNRLYPLEEYIKNPANEIFIDEKDLKIEKK